MANPQNMFAPQEEQLNNELININQLMQQADESLRRRLEEDRFVNVFLPMFAGISNLYNVSVDSWIGLVAFSPSNEVDIIDKQGNVLYTVPAIYNNASVAGVSNDVSIASEVMTVGKIAQISPNDAANLFQERIENNLIIVNAGENTMTNWKRWQAIFNRYNITPNLSPDFKKLIGYENDNTATPTTPRGEEEPIDFEEC